MLKPAWTVIEPRLIILIISYSAYCLLAGAAESEPEGRALAAARRGGDPGDGMPLARNSHTVGMHAFAIQVGTTESDRTNQMAAPPLQQIGPSFVLLCRGFLYTYT